MEVNDRPIFYHCPHSRYRQANWGSFIEDARRIIKEKQECPVPNDVSIATYNNHKRKCLMELVWDSYKIPYVVLGKKWRKWDWTAKVILPIRHLEKCDSTYVIITDGDDVYADKPFNIIPRFLEMDCDILFCASHSSFPPNFTLKNFEKESYKSEICHLNAGVLIGKREYVLEKLKEIWRLKSLYRFKYHGHFDDQLAWKWMHYQYYPQIKIDTEQKIIKRVP